MPASATNSLRVAVLADSDTRWKWGALTAQRLTPRAAGVRLDGYLLRGRATPTARQLREVGVRADSLREVTGVEFLRAMTEDPDGRYDVLVLALVGGGVQAMLHGLRAAWGPGPRPVVVTGYVGVVYEKLADGLLLRHGADLVLANSRHDADRFRAVYEGVGADASAVTEVALPFLGGAPYTGAHEPFTVVFAAQPSVPDNRRDRAYLLGRLVEHARRHPEREVLLKLRSKPGEHTTHIEELPYQKLVQGQDPPANFRLVYGHMGEVLDRTDLLVTVSSTAALEALHRRVPTAVLTDLGVREALGNHHFTGSGCLASWDQLDAGTGRCRTRSGWPGRAWRPTGATAPPSTPPASASPSCWTGRAACRPSTPTTPPRPRPATCPASSPATTSAPTAPRCPAHPPPTGRPAPSGRSCAGPRAVPTGTACSGSPP